MCVCVHHFDVVNKCAFSCPRMAEKVNDSELKAMSILVVSARLLPKKY